MSITYEFEEHEQTSPYGAEFLTDEGPFSEAMSAAPALSDLVPWTEGPTPFAETESLEAEGSAVSEAESIAAEALAELRDEAFDEALGELVAETEDVVAQRFGSESEAYGDERERLGRTHLGPLQFEAERYLTSLAEGLAGQDLAALDPQQLDEVLDRYDPQHGPLSPASEQFLGGLLNKAKGLVKGVVNTAKNAAKAVGNTVIGPVLKKLLGLIKPLLDRVLKMAIGKLPQPLQAPARSLIGKLGLEAEGEGFAEAFGEESESEALVETGFVTSSGFQPAMLTDVEALAEGFDAALSEAVAAAGTGAVGELEGFADEGEAEQPPGGQQLERLAQARGQLIDAIGKADDGENLAPAIENFLPVLMGALKLGLKLVGRQRVVNFLAKYLAKLIGRFVGPSVAGPLSTAIVDAGLKLVSLEAESEQGADREAVPTMLAATIEDTARRMSEQEDYVLDNEELLQLAAAEAFEHAVATNFPPRFVKHASQQAPTIGGHFRTRRPRSLHPHRRFSASPEIEVTAALADTIHTFGGATLGAALRAQGVVLPVRARVVVYEAVAGTTARGLVAADARLRGRPGAVGQLHPLTRHAAGALLREPRLGVAVPGRYLASPGRIAVGQRLYRVEPVGAPPAAATAKPTAARVRIDLRAGAVRVKVYLSELDAQKAALGVRQGRGAAAILDAVGRPFAALRFGVGDHSVVVVRERPESEDEAAQAVRRLSPKVLAAVRRAIRGWFLGAVAEWAKANGESFARAAADPASGVTVTVTLSAVPGLDLVKSAAAGSLTAAQTQALETGAALRGTPKAAVVVAPGRRTR